MFPAKFDYHAPSSLDDAIKLLAEGDGDVKVLAGGNSLLPLMKLRLAQPKAVVDLGRIKGLAGIKIAGNTVVIGPMTTHYMLESAAELKARGPNGERTIKAADFFVDMLTSALEPNEILTEIRIPIPAAKTGG